MAARVAAPLAAAVGAGVAIQAARESVQAQKKLQAVLSATGGAAGVTADQIQQLAGELQRTTNFEDDTTVAAAGMLATFKKIKGSVFTDAIRLAQDLSAVMGTDLESSILLVGRALNDPLKGMRALKFLTAAQRDEITKLAKAGDLAGAQAKILDAMKKTVGGAAKAMADPITLAKNEFGELVETIGKGLLQVVNPAAQFVADNLHVVTEAVGDFIEGATFYFNNFEKVSKLAAVNFALGFIESVPFAEQAIEGIAAFFKGTFAGLGAFFDVFIANIRAGFQNLVNYVKEVVTSAMKVREAIDKGGMAAGAKVAAKEAINAQKRLDKSHMEGAGNPFDAFGKAFTKAQDETLDGFRQGGGIAEMLRKQREALINGVTADEMKRIEQEKKLAPAIPGFGIGEEEEDVDKGKKKDQGQNSAALRGSGEAFSAIVKAMNQSEKSEAKKTADNTKKTAEHTKRMQRDIAAMARNTVNVSEIDSFT